MTDRIPGSPERASGSGKDRKATGATLVPAAYRVPTHLARRNQICVGARAEIMASDGITPREHAVIAAIDDLPGLDQRTLAARLAIDPVTAGQMLDRLEGMRLVNRRVHPGDRRARVLRLTSRGSNLRRRLVPEARAAHDRIMAPLSAAERKTFINLLVRLVEGNEAYARPGNGRRRPGSAS